MTGPSEARSVGWLDQRAAKALVWPLYVVVSDVLVDELSQVCLTQRDDAVETLLFDRADEAFDKGVQVGAAPRQASRLHSGVSEHVPDVGSEYRGTIHDDDR